MTYKHHHATLLAVTLCMTSVITALAQSPTPKETTGLTGYKVTHIAGLPETKPNLRGRLTTTDTNLLFTNPGFKAEIPFTRITSVSTGDVRIETGGKTGRIVRTIIPYGGGVALATVTQKSADLLTIEYLDEKGGYHGAVFFVPKFSAKALSDRISPQLTTTAPLLPQPCENGASSSTSVTVEPILASGVELPAEYRVLLYENLIHELRDSTSAASYIRAGSFEAGIGCSAMKLKISVTGFKKGNQALRASTGPIGLFVGKTSVSYHVELTDADGRKIFAEDINNSKRMDSESLGIAKSVAKTVAKKLRKLPTQQLAG